MGPGGGYGPWWKRNQTLSETSKFKHKPFKDYDADKKSRVNEGGHLVRPSYRKHTPLSLVPRRIKPSEFHELLELQVHANTVASVVAANSEVLSARLVNTAEDLLATAGKANSHKLASQGIMPVDRSGRQIIAVGQVGEGIRTNIYREEVARISQFIIDARQEIKDVVKSKQVNIPLRQLIDFWDPAQRVQTGYFIYYHARTITRLLPKEDFVGKANLLGLVNLNQNKWWKYNDLTPEDFSDGLIGLNNLYEYLRKNKARYLHNHLGNDYARFVEGFYKLKESLIS